MALFVPNIATQIYLILNKTMLGVFDNTNVAGFYDQSDKVVKMILAIVTVTGTVMLPHVAYAFANGKKKAIIKYLYDSFDFVTAMYVICDDFWLGRDCTNFHPDVFWL